MLPAISAFSNEHFYHGSIRDAQSRIEAVDACKQYSRADSAVLFVHHTNFEVKVGQSLANPREADIIMQLVQDQQAAGQSLEDIGIISAYLAQANLLAQKARAIFGDDAARLEIHTVDGFQGRDKPTIIISTVRSNSNAAIGFLKDERRLNVALTRAEDRLFVVGNRNTLGYTNLWTGQGHIFSKYVDWAAKVSKRRSVFPACACTIILTHARPHPLEQLHPRLAQAQASLIRPLLTHVHCTLAP